MAWTVPPAETGAANLIAEIRSLFLDHSSHRKPKKDSQHPDRETSQKISKCQQNAAVL